VHDALWYAAIVVAWLQTLAALVSTFSKTMIRLRFASVLANICGVFVGAASANPASFIRHLVILPVDLIRLREMRRLVKSVKKASSTDLNVEWLKPFMHPLQRRRGQMLFRKGDEAAEAFILADGEIELTELGRVLTPGELFGEMALFTENGARTASARCLTDVRLLAITYEQFEQLYFQNPKFGLYLVRLIVNRFQANLAQFEGAGAPIAVTPTTAEAADPL
jgi:hypothetical protein